MKATETIIGDGSAPTLPTSENVREAIETGLREGWPVSMDIDTHGPNNRDYTVTVTFRHSSAIAA